jgi:hypothetical protein
MRNDCVMFSALDDEITPLRVSHTNVYTGNKINQYFPDHTNDALQKRSTDLAIINIFPSYYLPVDIVVTTTFLVLLITSD